MSDHKWSEFIGVLNAVQECTIVCPYYKSCGMTSFSPVCIVKEMCEDDLRRYFNLYILGEEGIRAEIMNKLFELGALVDKKEFRSVSSYIEQLLRVNKQVYMERKLVQEQEQDFRIEVTSNGFGQKKIPGIVIDEADDPESLFNSPNIQKIVGRK